VGDTVSSRRQLAKRSVTGVAVVHCPPKSADDGTEVGGTWRQMLPPSNAAKELDGIRNSPLPVVVCARWTRLFGL